MSVDIAAKLQELGYHPIVPSDYRSHVDNWTEWYRGDVRSYHHYTIYNGSNKIKRQRKSLGMAKTIAEDWANLLLNERVAINAAEGFKPTLDGVLQRNNFAVQANQLLEQVFALGTGALVEYKTETGVDIDYIAGPGKIYPLAWDNNTITACGFGSIKVLRNVECCYIQVHARQDNGNYIVCNYICDNQTGALMSDDFYAAVGVTAVIDTKSPVPKYQIIRPNIVNNVDMDCPYGISVYANAIPVLQALDMVYDSYCNEYDLGRKRIILPLGLAQMQANQNGDIRPVFDPTDVVFYAMPDKAFGDDAAKKPLEINMTIRAAEHEQGLKSNLALLSKKCGLGNDRYQFDHDAVKTATEVVSEKSDLYQNLKKHELLLKSALLGMVAAIADLYGYRGDLQASVKFDDSIINDDNTRLDNHIKRIDAGLETHADAIADLDNITAEQAAAKYKIIVEEQRLMTGADVDNYGTEYDEDADDGGEDTDAPLGGDG